MKARSLAPECRESGRSGNEKKALELEDSKEGLVPSSPLSTPSLGSGGEVPMVVGKSPTTR